MKHKVVHAVKSISLSLSLSLYIYIYMYIMFHSRKLGPGLPANRHVSDWRMMSSGMLLLVALVRTDVSDELSSSFIRVTKIGELGTTLAVTSNQRTMLVTASVVPSWPILVTLMKEALSSSETSVLTRAIRRNNPEYTILQSHRRENLKSYMFQIEKCRLQGCYAVWLL
jgi:hypothetical protein